MNITFRLGACLLLLEACSHAPPLTTSVPAVSAAAGFLAGAAARDITPDLARSSQTVYVAGLERGSAATGIRDPLFARALVMTDRKGVTVGLVILDLIGFFHDDVEELREELKRRHPETTIDYLAVASTHTHAGPDVLGLWTPVGGSVDADYVAHVRSEAVEAVAEAWRLRRPALVYTGTATAPGLAIDTRLPEVIDETVMVMGLRAASDGSGIAALVQWNSHPSVMGGDNTEISADFPRHVVQVVEKEWGGTALYASGALGGQIGSGRLKISDPATGKRAATRARLAEIVGGRIGEIALGALQEAGATGDVRDPMFRWRSRGVLVPLDNPRFTEGLAIGLIRARRLYPLPAKGPRDDAGTGWLPQALPRDWTLHPGAYALKSEVAVVDLGPIRWVLVPGELYPELSIGGIQQPQDPGADFPGAPSEPALRRLSARQIFIIGLANDELGYIIPRSEWDSEPPYAYGREEPQYGEKNSCGPGTAPILLNALADLL